MQQQPVPPCPTSRATHSTYTIGVVAEGGRTGTRSLMTVVSLPARGIVALVIAIYIRTSFNPSCFTPPAPPTPTVVTGLVTLTGIRVGWQWTSSGPAPSCFNTTSVTYHPEGGGESSLQLRDPATTETILTGLQCNTRYTITVVATAGEHRRESAAIAVFLPLRGILES